MKRKDSLAGRIGSRLKTLRKQRGLTLIEIARQVQLSPSFLSRIENGRTMPSIQTLQLIADTLKIDIGFFFQQQHGKGYVVSRAGSRRIIPADNGKFEGDPAARILYDTEPLVEGMENPFMVPLILRITKRDTDDEIKPLPHGGQEFLYVLEGKIIAILGEDFLVVVLLFDQGNPTTQPLSIWSER